MSASKRILAALAEHEPVDGGERASLKHIRSFVEATEAPMDRSNEEGHVVASGLIASPDRARIVLLHHRKLDMWLQPGGHAEPGEQDPRAVAQREAREETGLDVELWPATTGVVDVDAHRIPATDAMPEHWHFDLRYVFQADPSQEPSVPEAEGHEVRWFDVDEALAELDLDEGLRRSIGKLQGLRPRSGP